jgi:cytochrome c oxidase subunit 2
MKVSARFVLSIAAILSILLISACSSPGSGPTGTSGSPAPSTSATSTTGPAPSVANGKMIYNTSTSDSGAPITYTGGPGMMMPAELACATCHGPQGHGGTVHFMMQTFDVPSITWPVLTGPDPDMQHPPYTEATLKQAITQGIDPGGSPLDYPMPRWQMSLQDLDDLVSFITTLK